MLTAIHPEPQHAWPKYGSKPAKPGLYLGLFHGRHHPREQMNGWGFDGPAIGPLRWCHTTYATDIKIEFEEAVDALAYFGKVSTFFDLTIQEDLLVFGNAFFGDWTVYYVGPDECELPPDGFRPSRRGGCRYAHRRIP